MVDLFVNCNVLFYFDAITLIYKSRGLPRKVILTKSLILILNVVKKVFVVLLF